MVKCSCEDRQIFVQKSSHFFEILPVNLHNFFAKHVNLQLAQTTVFEGRCYQYTHSMYIRTRQSSGTLAQRYVRVLVVVYNFLSVNLNFVLSLIRILCKCSNFVLSLIRSLLLTSPNSQRCRHLRPYRIIHAPSQCSVRKLQ